jgi:hypothetical protein
VSIGALPSLSRYFKCPNPLLEIEIERTASKDPGFFQFGADTICFGRSSQRALPDTPNQDLPDLSKHVSLNDQGTVFPFDPEEIIQNLREERYVSSAKYAQNDGLVRDLYYAMRPWMPLGFRKYLQRLYLRGWDKLPFPKWPVDRTVDRLLQRLLIIALKSRGLESVPFIWFWPDGANACAIMTHDVEAVPGKNFCSRLMDIDDSFRIPASFQIVPEVRYPVEPEFLEEIRSRGFEINVQDLNHDGRLFQHRHEFERRVKAINRYAKEYQAVGFRSAVLYRKQGWFDLLDFEYDTSVPSVAHLDPQRGGCCTIMPYFVGKLLELPVTATQDHSLFNVLHDFSTNLWEQQTGYILKHHGLMNFIVHPDYILGDEAQDSFKRLLGLLVNLRQKNGVWIALPRDVNRWWRQRDQMTLTRKGDRWTIEGPGSERARVAFASLEGEGLVYSFAEKAKSMSRNEAGDGPSGQEVRSSQSVDHLA